MERGNGFGPISLQSRSEDRRDARTGRRLCHRRNGAEVPTEPETVGALAGRVARSPVARASESMGAAIDGCTVFEALASTSQKRALGFGTTKSISSPC